LLEVQCDGVKVCRGGDVRDDRVHGSKQPAGDADEGRTASEMQGIADTGPGSASAAGYIERWSEGERHGGPDEAALDSAEAVRNPVSRVKLERSSRFGGVEDERVHGSAEAASCATLL
jgi:hypothetical protein